MTTWNVNAALAAGKYIGKVKARTAEEALKRAQRHPNLGVSVCHQCADEVTDPEIIYISVCNEDGSIALDDDADGKEQARVRATLDSIRAVLKEASLWTGKVKTAQLKDALTRIEWAVADLDKEQD